MKSSSVKKIQKKKRMAIDTTSRKRSGGASKRGRGRPRKIQRNWVTGHAYDNSIMLGQVWSKLEAPLIASQTKEDVIAAIKSNGEPYAEHFVSSASDILSLIRNKKFPKRGKARISFLANSLAGRPQLTLRSSRDICEKDRAQRKQKSQHRILRHEFYIECSCGYKGPALDNSCPKCHAEIPFSLGGFVTF